MVNKLRRKSKIKPRKPIEKPKQFCFNINSTIYINKQKELITDFVQKLYTNKRWKDPFNKDDFFVIFDKNEKRVCIELHRKINANYIKLENIHKKLKPSHLKISDKIYLKEPLADVHIHHLRSSQKKTVPKGLKWITLSHHGPYFTWLMEPYVPHGVKIKYEGKKYKLRPNTEQIANFWARRITTDKKATIVHTKNKKFRNNFWKDFKTYLSPSNKKIMKNFDKFNFEDIRQHLVTEKEKETEKSKRIKKQKSAERMKDFGFAIVNGVKEKIGGFTPEPSSLFLGRGKNPLRGRIKKDISPSDVTINIGKKSKIPKPPKGKWKKVIHNQKAQWISKWTDSLTGKPKYIYLSAESQFKSGSDASKFENARKLNKYITTVRNYYNKDIKSKSIKTRQLAVIIWFVDTFGIRMGGEKGEDKAQTYGISTLLIKHLKFKSDNKIKLTFLGKDSIKYDKTLLLTSNVYNNLKNFIGNRSSQQPIFNKVSACDVNNYLQKIDKGFSGKVFRTRLASTIMYNELYKQKFTKSSTINNKKNRFLDANIKVAKALNHQKTITKTSLSTIDKMKKDLKKLEEELKSKLKDGNKKVSTLEKRIKVKKDSISKKQKLTSINPGTSLTNYIDPRLVSSWCKLNDIPIEKIYTVTLRNKFKWAIDSIDKNWDYVNTPLEEGFKELDKSIKSDICTIIEVDDDSSSDDSSSDESSEDESSSDESSEDESSDEEDSGDESILTMFNTKRLFKKYIKIIKKFGYSLIKLDNNEITIKRVDKRLLKTMNKNAFTEIYYLCEKLKKNNFNYLLILLVSQLCKDGLNSKIVKNDLKKTGYLTKFINIVKK